MELEELLYLLDLDSLLGVFGVERSLWNGTAIMPVHLIPCLVQKGLLSGQPLNHIINRQDLSIQLRISNREKDEIGQV